MHRKPRRVSPLARVLRFGSGILVAAVLVTGLVWALAPADDAVVVSDMAAAPLPFPTPPVPAAAELPDEDDRLATRADAEAAAQERAEAEAKAKAEADEAKAEADEAARRQAALDAAARSADRAQADPKSAARALMAEYGWGEDQFSCLDSLWTRESNWKYNAENPSSGAYGIPQSLPASKMAEFGDDYLTNPITQITWGLSYMDDRYGTPCSAWGHSESVGWY
ncbi:MAG: lytic transglycosylase domain-containing protein [Jiangellaceae bacterium]